MAYSLCSAFARSIFNKAGEEFFALCKNIVGQIAQGINVIREKDFESEGSLKIGTGIGTSDTILENISEFIQKFPKIHFSFISTIDIYHFQIGDADVGIIQHVLYESALRIYAAPCYIEKHSKPKDLSELKHYKLISYVGNDEMADKEINIHLKNINYHTQPLIQVNNGLALQRALVSGLGISVYEYDRRLIENNLLVDIFPTII